MANVYVMMNLPSERPGHRTKEEVLADIEGELRKNIYKFIQPIQMRFNELISGVRADVAVKVFGDDLDVMAETAGQIEKVLGTVPGAADVKTGRAPACPCSAWTSTAPSSPATA